MRRLLLDELLIWRDRPSRMPLLLRGARQTGKTYLVESFAQAAFENCVTINFELEPLYKACFESLKPEKIIQQLSALSGESIRPGQTLLFLDEIQECPPAIQALRYFKEKMPELHVIGAGSLLEFALANATFRMPVGRVEFLYLYPLSFIEFLFALNQDALVEYIKTATLENPLPGPIHDRLLEHLRYYCIVGGMPAVIASYLVEQDLQRVQSLQLQILATYRNDFGKYASQANQRYCQIIFNKIPEIFAKNFKYVDIDPTVESRSLKVALQLLFQAGIVIPVYQSNASGQPLNALVVDKKFKLLSLDVGLIKAAGKLDLNVLMDKNFLDIRSGALAEQFVGQQLLNLQPVYDKADLFYWQRDKRGSQAEIDYLIMHAGEIIPIEVKAGKAGRLRSLHAYLAEKHGKIGIKLSTENMQKQDKILMLPLYMVSEIGRLLDGLC
jgi:predicted AAA+ superfamily ATPase